MQSYSSSLRCPVRVDSAGPGLAEPQSGSSSLYLGSMSSWWLCRRWEVGGEEIAISYSLGNPV